jgi:hypothetical protein
MEQWPIAGSLGRELLEVCPGYEDLRRFMRG